MSYREERFLKYEAADSFKAPDFLEDNDAVEIRELFLKVLNRGIHGFCYSVYEEGQKPGDIVGEGQIRARMKILKPYAQWVRSFSCIEGNEIIPAVAKEMGLKTLVGAWLGSDEEKNREEIDNLILLAKEGLVDVASVGNEVLYRNELSEAQLLSYIQEVKSSITKVPVGYVDAYYEFLQRPILTEACDVILCNCYPYWEGTPFEHSFQHMQHMYSQALQAGRGKRVLITETGWPSHGKGLGGAVPSTLNFMKYFINTHLWANQEKVEIFHFSSFDESWKVGAEGDVGAHWGIWDKFGKMKF